MENKNIQGTSDAWSLPVHKRLSTHYEDEQEKIFLDDVDRAFTSCWNGCPECIENIRITLGGHRGLNFIDKYILDCWFLEGVQDSEDYGIHNPGVSQMEVKYTSWKSHKNYI